MLRRRPRGSVQRGRQAPSYASAGSLRRCALFGCYALIGGGADVAGLDRVPTCRLRHRRRSSASDILRSGRTQATTRVFQECGARRIVLRSISEGRSARGPAPAECPGPAALPSSPPPSASSDAARPRRSPQRPPHLRRPEARRGRCLWPRLAPARSGGRSGRIPSLALYQLLARLAFAAPRGPQAHAPMPAWGRATGAP